MYSPDENGGYYDDDGNKLDPNLIPKPSLCASCANDEDPEEEILCNLNRLDQHGEADFECGAYKPKTPTKIE
jgi:hypothetical protein